MNIWLINHYAVPTKYYPLARTATFAKYLMQMGHTVTIFAASTVHNSDKNLIEDGSLYKEDTVEGIHYVYVRDCNYTGNGLKRILNMLLFPTHLSRVCKHFSKPDAILATSVTPMACMKGIKLAKKYRCRGVAEIADLWPESFVAYGLLKENSPILKPLYAYEKSLYTKADAIVFTMEGGRDYITEKGWDKEHGGPVDLGKVHHINNGISLSEFDYNRSTFSFNDTDLDDESTFKVIYTGSIRKANEVGRYIDIALELLKRKADRVKILIWGAGDQAECLSQKIAALGLSNIVLKGSVDKKYIPYILSKGDLNTYMLTDSPLFKFGLSLNKSFEYFASGKPVLTSSNSGYSIIDRYQCGVCLPNFSPERMADEIINFVDMPKVEYDTFCANAITAARAYDFQVLTQKLAYILGNIEQDGTQNSIKENH